MAEAVLERDAPGSNPGPPLIFEGGQMSVEFELAEMERDPRNRCPNARKWTDDVPRHEFDGRGVKCIRCGATKKRRSRSGHSVEVSHIAPDWDGTPTGFPVNPGEKKELYGLTIENTGGRLVRIERIKWEIGMPKPKRGKAN